MNPPAEIDVVVSLQMALQVYSLARGEWLTPGLPVAYEEIDARANLDGDGSLLLELRPSPIRYRSTDGGATWERVAEPLPSPTPPPQP